MLSKYQKPIRSWRNMVFAGRGVIYTWKTQGHFRFQLLAAAAAAVCGWVLGISRLEWLILILTMGCVLCAEIVNTAIELAVDLSEPNFHPLAGLAKDVAAGAVLLAALMSCVVGAVLFVPPLVRMVF